MDIIDEKGRLFGVVNVIDALVVLLAVAVVSAGAALVLGSDDDTPVDTGPNVTSTHATLDLGTQPDYIVSQLNESDTYSPGGDNNLTITDVRLEPRNDGRTAVTLRVKLWGVPNDEGTLQYDGAPPRLGRSLNIITDRYQVAGTITSLDGDVAIPTTERQVLVTTTVDTDTAGAIQEGDAFTLRERTLATVKSVDVYGTDSPDRKRVSLGLTLDARQTNDGAKFAGKRLDEGTTIPFRTSEYALTADIQRVGATEPRGDPATRTVTLQLRNVTPDLADAIEAGMTESVNGETIAAVTDVDRENATLVLTSQDGNVYQREHPRNVDVTLTADLAVRETDTRVTFKGRTLQHGSTVTLDLGSVTVRATVASL